MMAGGGRGDSIGGGGLLGGGDFLGGGGEGGFLTGGGDFLGGGGERGGGGLGLFFGSGAQQRPGMRVEGTPGTALHAKVALVPRESTTPMVEPHSRPPLLSAV